MSRRFKVRVSKLNSFRTQALLQFGDLRIVLTDCKSPALACVQAAKILRDAADRFEALTREQDPYTVETFQRINQYAKTIQA